MPNSKQACKLLGRVKLPSWFNDFIHQEMCQLGFVTIIIWIYTDNMIP